MLPLIIAVTYAALEMSSQARAQQRLVMDQAQISQLSITVQELNKEIERSARQYQLLQDQSLLEILKIKQHQLSESLSKIERQLPELKNSSTLTKIEQITADINKASRSDDPKQKRQLATLYADLKSASNDLHNQLSKAVQSNLNNAEQALNNVLWRMLITGLLALPASLLLLGASSIIVTRSIRRLSLAINHLGERSWDTPIDIDGPSDLIELGHRLEWMRVQLLGAEQYKAQFTQHITHELKSPLAAIMDAQALLADQIPGQLNDKQMAVLTILRNQAENLQELIQQLLNFNAVSQGIAAHKEQIDLSLMCKNLIARYRSFLPDTALNIKTPSNGQLVTGNAQLIEMILSNLLSNAIHFCRTGGEIAINWGHCNIKQHSHDVNAPPEDCSHWWLQVSDNGPGIDIDEQEAVFRPFYQGKNKRHGALKGSGIGLAIVKACAEQAQATLTLKSQKDQGAEFTLCFPKQR
ncbi:MAG: two-component system sensor histidine kinase GlrK [Zhongshania aliphaticivorans]|jgi:two-component system sensor histidine kinase GlrK|tara:strand:+ start:194 stop:1600 length:1407 start_codon:yes stop_codon:yes gene_type:complete